MPDKAKTKGFTRVIKMNRQMNAPRLSSALATHKGNRKNGSCQLLEGKVVTGRGKFATKLPREDKEIFSSDHPIESMHTTCSEM